ncbi:hypothetical protein QWZ04_01795 [Vibrio tapetis subsp. quintayensis]|nr:hypothetical protein [Vibrio tapetis]MDN3679058.1 hypothetical protein [Vibrio tapetis subsp. quintayensis]
MNQFLITRFAVLTQEYRDVGATFLVSDISVFFSTKKRPSTDERL